MAKHAIGHDLGIKEIMDPPKEIIPMIWADNVGHIDARVVLDEESRSMPWVIPP